MIRDALLAAGVVMSAAAQLRIAGLPIGPGELCLGLWLLLSAGYFVAGDHARTTTPLRIIVAFWIVLALSLSIGAFVGILIDDPWDRGDMTHDSLAYLLAAGMTCLALAQIDADHRLRRTAWFAIAFGNAALLAQIALGFGWVSAPGINSWYWDRFRGWSENPNQLALYCAVLGPLALHLATTSERRVGFLFGALGVVLPIIAGRLSKSDTFLLAMLAAVSVLLGLRLTNWLRVPTRRLRFATAIILVVGFPPIVLSLLANGFATANEAETMALSLAKDRGGDATVQTANLRFYLWEEAVRRGLESGSLGLGPGPHLERPPVTNEQALPRPYEAHNTFLDLFTQGGIIALLALLGLFACAIVFALRGRVDALAALLVSLLAFGVTHFILRHPVTWFAIAFCLVAGVSRTSVIAANRQR